MPRYGTRSVPQGKKPVIDVLIVVEDGMHRARVYSGKFHLATTQPYHQRHELLAYLRKLYKGYRIEVLKVAPNL